MIASAPIPLATPDLRFRQADHTYTIAGHVVPSVTQVLDDNRLRCDYSTVPWPVLEAARLRGAAVHLATHYDDEGTLDEATVSDDVRPYLDAWRLFRHERRVTIVELERRYGYAALHFAGTIDRIAGVPGYRAPIVVDIKTGDTTGVALQLAAYGELYRNATGVLLVERWCVVLCPERQVPYIVREHHSPRDWRIFRSALDCTHARAELGLSWRKVA